jgi:glycosyltransferase involved in cell wall biosynthesis
MKTLIVIPTYNERENIIKIIPAIKKSLKGAHVLVVDDNSPDGTGAAVKSIGRRDKNVALIERPGKSGLGKAYVEGFKYALKKKYDYIFEMDADLSHNPEYGGHGGLRPCHRVQVFERHIGCQLAHTQACAFQIRQHVRKGHNGDAADRLHQRF